MSELPVASSISTIPTGDRKTLGQMVTDIATMFGLQGATDKEAMIRRIIHSIIDDLNRRKLWRFNLLTAADFTSTSGDGTYDLTTIAPDLWRVYSLRKTSDIDYLLTGVQQRLFDTIFQSQNSITGYPYIRHEFNLYRDGTLRLFPVPDGVYTFQLRYFRLIPHPNGDGTFLDMPSPYQSVVEYGACHRAAAMADQKQHVRDYWKGEYEQAYQEMNEQDEWSDEEDLRMIHVEELSARGSYLSPNARPRWLDLY